MTTIIVTGAAGFIGSALCRYLRRNRLARVVGLDKMTYAASRESLSSVGSDEDFRLVETDICNGETLAEVLRETQPDGLIHLAAETHVDRSIDRPGDFLQVNIVGTYTLLEAMRYFLPLLDDAKRAAFRFLHVSTDEVYGALGSTGAFNETSAYHPNSPYAATKAAADHLARAWHRTFGLPILISNSSNNYGPFQFPEKLIPLCIAKAMKGEPIPVYGNGLHVRDWLYVDDHAEALYHIFRRAPVGEKYHVGGQSERRNIDVVEKLCDLLDEALPNAAHKPHRRLIRFVADRPGHDERYAMDVDKVQRELGWSPRTGFEDGLSRTVAWYVENRSWCQDVQRRKYAGERLGLLTSMESLQ